MFVKKAVTITAEWKYTLYFFKDKNYYLCPHLDSSSPTKFITESQASFDFQLLDDNNAVQILKYVTNDLFKKGIVLIRDFVFNTNSLNEREFHNLRKAGFKHFKKGNGFVWREIGEFDMNPNDFYLSRMATQGVN